MASNDSDLLRKEEQTVELFENIVKTYLTTTKEDKNASIDTQNNSNQSSTKLHIPPILFQMLHICHQDSLLKTTFSFSLTLNDKSSTQAIALKKKKMSLIKKWIKAMNSFIKNKNPSYRRVGLTLLAETIQVAEYEMFQAQVTNWVSDISEILKVR